MDKLKAWWNHVRETRTFKAVRRLLLAIACRKAEQKTGVPVCDLIDKGEKK